MYEAMRTPKLCTRSPMTWMNAARTLMLLGTSTSSTMTSFDIWYSADGDVTLTPSMSIRMNRGTVGLGWSVSVRQTSVRIPGMDLLSRTDLGLLRWRSTVGMAVVRQSHQHSVTVWTQDVQLCYIVHLGCSDLGVLRLGVVPTWVCSDLGLFRLGFVSYLGLLRLSDLGLFRFGFVPSRVCSDLGLFRLGFVRFGFVPTGVCSDLVFSTWGCSNWGLFRLGFVPTACKTFKECIWAIMGYNVLPWLYIYKVKYKVKYKYLIPRKCQLF